MATLELSKTVARPTTDLRMDAFLFNQTIAQPTLSAIMNDWNLGITVAKPTLVAELISGEIFSLNKTILKPTIEAVLLSGNLLQVNKTVRRPTVVISILSPNTYNLSKGIPKPTLQAFISLEGQYGVVRTIPRPLLIANWLNDRINDTSVTYVLNTFNSAHTTYTNFRFNSYFMLNGSYYGVNSTGIYLLDGNLDVATGIQTEVHTPISDFQKQGLKACSDAIMLGRLDGEMEVITVNDEQEEREGVIIRGDDRQGLHRIRAKIPKGLKGSVWQYKLKNIDGSQFAINNLEVFLKELQRVR